MDFEALSHKLIGCGPTQPHTLRPQPASLALVVLDHVHLATLIAVGNDQQVRTESYSSRLKEVFRQAAHSRIITTAHRINEGHMPEIPAKDAESDFYFIDRAEPEQIAATLLDMVKKRIPAKFGFDAIRDIQMLCPMNRGSLGIRELNLKLQGELNPARPEEPVVEKFGWQFRPRDKVIQTENNYDKDVFNGDIGQIIKIDPVEREVTVRFDQREVVYDFGELDEVALGYAITGGLSAP